MISGFTNCRLLVFIPWQSCRILKQNIKVVSFYQSFYQRLNDIIRFVGNLYGHACFYTSKCIKTTRESKNQSDVFVENELKNGNRMLFKTHPFLGNFRNFLFSLIYIRYLVNTALNCQYVFKIKS